MACRRPTATEPKRKSNRHAFCTLGGSVVHLAQRRHCPAKGADLRSERAGAQSGDLLEVCEPKEIREFRNKEAMVIDQRWNGGGNIEQELLAILVQREYQVWVPRGVEAAGRPFAGYFGPKVVLQNWRSASNAASSWS